MAAILKKSHKEKGSSSKPLDSVPDISTSFRGQEKTVVKIKSDSDWSNNYRCITYSRSVTASTN